MTFSFGIDAITLFRQQIGLPTVIAALLPNTTILSTTSHVALAAGLLLALPSVATGLSELYEMWKGQSMQKGFKKATMDAFDPNVDDPAADKLFTTIRHAGTMDTVILGGVYNWWTRRGTSGVMSTNSNYAVSMFLLPLMLYGAYLGGHLVYHQGGRLFTVTTDCF